MWFWELRERLTLLDHADARRRGALVIAAVAHPELAVLDLEVGDVHEATVATLFGEGLLAEGDGVPRPVDDLNRLCALSHTSSPDTPWIEA
jgi:hypothetical protein